MKYSLTDKLNFTDDPVIEINGVELAVKTDAEVVLKLLDVLNSSAGDEFAGIKETVAMLFSAEDQKKLKGMKLKIKDYLAVIRAAVKLAIGQDPDEDQPGE